MDGTYTGKVTILASKREAGSGKGMGKRIVGERPSSPVPLHSSRLPLPALLQPSR